MERLIRPAKVVGQRFKRGAMIYLALNFALLLAEARWHVLARLTVWDISELKVLATMLSQTAHH